MTGIYELKELIGCHTSPELVVIIISTADINQFKNMVSRFCREHMDVLCKHPPYISIFRELLTMTNTRRLRYVTTKEFCTRVHVAGRKIIYNNIFDEFVDFLQEAGCRMSYAKVIYRNTNGYNVKQMVIQYYLRRLRPVINDLPYTDLPVDEDVVRAETHLRFGELIFDGAKV